MTKTQLISSTRGHIFLLYRFYTLQVSKHDVIHSSILVSPMESSIFCLSALSSPCTYARRGLATLLEKTLMSLVTLRKYLTADP